METAVLENEAVCLEQESEQVAEVEVEQKPSFANWLRRQYPENPRMLEIADVAETYEQLSEDERKALEAEAVKKQNIISRADRRKIAIARSGLSENMLKKNHFGLFKGSSRSQKLVYKAAVDWCKAYPDVRETGIALIGPTGRGKSLLLRSIASYLLTKSPHLVDVRYFFSLDLNAELRKDVEREGSIADAILHSCDVLVLDDVFKAVNDGMTRFCAEFYCRLFDQIDKEQRPLICWSANGSLKEVEAQFLEWDAEWLLKRLLKAVDAHEVDGPDGRTKVYSGGGNA